MPPWSTQAVVALQRDGHPSEDAFRRIIGRVDMTLLGLGAMIGVGIFVRTGTAAAQNAGPAVVIAFALAAVGSLLVAACYAELAGMLPVAGGAYTYTAAAFGRLAGWTVGWNLMLQYAFGAASVAVAWSSYVSHAVHEAGGVDLPAMGLIVAATVLVALGARATTVMNRWLVLLKLAVVVLVIAVGLTHATPDHWRPFVPPNTGAFGRFGWSGVVRATALVFPAFMGFDAIAAFAPDARSPQRTLPGAFLVSVAVCAVLYGLTALALTGLAPYTVLNAPEPVVAALTAARSSAWLVPIVHATVLVSLGSVTLVIVAALPRFLFAVARDGLLPPALAAVDGRTATPLTATVIGGGVAAIVAAFIPLGWLLDAISASALLASFAVCAALLAARYRHPNVHRPFRAPLWSLAPVLGMLFLLGVMVSIDVTSWMRVGLWNALGVLIYVAVMTARRGQRPV